MFLAASCAKTSPVYSNDGTAIRITVDEKTLSATRVKANFVLDDDEHYYYCEIIPRNSYVIQKDNSRYMQLKLDSVYVEYVNWRYDYLKKDEEYIASFPSHCLWYGNDYWEFSGLSPETEYTILAFCVNPDTKQPSGELYYAYFTTPPVKKSSMTFKFYYDLNLESPRITVEPSNDNEPYYAQCIASKTLDESSGGDVKKYVQEMVDFCHEVSEFYGYDVLSEACKKRSQNILIEYPQPQKYVVFAFGYDGVITTDIFYEEFTIE